MRDPAGSSVANSTALRVVLGLGGVFILILLGARLVGLVGFVHAVGVGLPLVLVEPGILGDVVLAVAILLVPFVFLLPRTWRLGAIAVLCVGALILVGISGSLTARGGSGVSHTPVAHWLESHGYVRCPAADAVRGSGRATRGEYVAEGWALPGACPGPAGTRGDAQTAHAHADGLVARPGLAAGVSAGFRGIEIGHAGV